MGGTNSDQNARFPCGSEAVGASGQAVWIWLAIRLASPVQVLALRIVGEPARMQRLRHLEAGELDWDRACRQPASGRVCRSAPGSSSAPISESVVNLGSGVPQRDQRSAASYGIACGNFRFQLIRNSGHEKARHPYIRGTGPTVWRPSHGRRRPNFDSYNVDERRLFPSIGRRVCVPRLDGGDLLFEHRDQASDAVLR